MWGSRAGLSLWSQTQGASWKSKTWGPKLKDTYQVLGVWLSIEYLQSEALFDPQVKKKKAMCQRVGGLVLSPGSCLEGTSNGRALALVGLLWRKFDSS